MFPIVLLDTFQFYKKHKCLITVFIFRLLPKKIYLKHFKQLGALRHEKNCKHAQYRLQMT